jgi:ribosomal protein S18 acetylase RimI-like enzyme
MSSTAGKGGDWREVGSPSIRELTNAELGQLEPLWLALHRHHRAVSPVKGLVDDDAASWSARRADYERWMRAGNAIALVADVPPSTAVGYLFVRLHDGPDDTFAVGARYAEIYSLSVAPACRRHGVGTSLLDALDRRLAELDIVDLMVSAMVGNEGAEHLYLERGFQPAEVTFWRLPHSASRA